MNIYGVFESGTRHEVISSTEKRWGKLLGGIPNGSHTEKRCRAKVIVWNRRMKF